jgi:hypothetical protein
MEEMMQIDRVLLRPRTASHLLAVVAVVLVSATACDKVGLRRPEELDWPPSIGPIKCSLEMKSTVCRLVVKWSASVDQQPGFTPQCRARLDQGAWTEWSKTHEAHFDSPADGLHMIEAEARNAVGIVSRASKSWNVDCEGGVEPPTVELRAEDISFDCYAMMATLNATCRAQDDGTPSDQLRYRWYLDGVPASGWGSASSQSWNHLGEGIYTIRVEVLDAGNRKGEDTYQVKIDCECDEPKFLYVTPDLYCENGYIMGEIRWAATVANGASVHLHYSYMIAPGVSKWSDHLGTSVPIKLVQGQEYTFHIRAVVDETGCSCEESRSLSCP